MDACISILFHVFQYMLYIASQTVHEREADTQWLKDGKRVSWRSRYAAMGSAGATIHVAM